MMSFPRNLMKKYCAAGALLAGAWLSAPVLAADNVDPALAKSWEFMQQAMPGVPYDVLKNACAEAKLTLYHGTWTDAEQARVAKFEERFPCIKVTRLELLATALRERFITEARAGRDTADIIQDTDTGALDKLIDQNLLMNYVISNDASYADKMKHRGYWYPLRIALVGLAWNTNLVSDEQAKILSDWKGAIDPAWTGRSAAQDPSAGGAVLLPFYVWTKLYGDDFIEKMGKLKPRVFGASGPSAAALASGDIAVLFNASETGLTPLWLSGAPIHWSMPEPGIGAISAESIPARAPHPNAAKLYHEYAFSLEGYTVWQKLGGAPARIGYKDQRKVAAEPWYHFPGKFYDYDIADANNAVPHILDLFHKYIGAFK